MPKFRLYRLARHGYRYNPSLRGWELFELKRDGSIKRLWDRVKTRLEAEAWVVERNR